MNDKNSPMTLIDWVTIAGILIVFGVLGMVATVIAHFVAKYW